MSNTKEELKEALKAHQDLDRVVRYVQDLDLQLDEANKKLDVLEKKQFKEFDELQKMEGTNLKSVFYKVLGSKENQIEKERQEYLQASMKYDEVKKSVDLLAYEREVLEKKLTDVNVLKNKIELLKKQRAGEIISSNSLVGQRLLQIVKEVDDSHHISNEIIEALEVGTKAINLLASIISNLKQAGNWGQWNANSRRRMSSYNKHSYIDRAKNLSHMTQQVLRQFEMELRDVYRQQNYELDVELASFSSFTTIFFDNLISDWVIQNKIQNSVANVAAVRDKVNRIMGNLQADRNNLESEVVRLETEYDELVMKH